MMGISVPHALFLFATTHDTIKAERLAAAAGVAGEVIPQPPGATGRCGVALQVPAPAATKWAEVLAAAGLADFRIEER